MASGPFQSLHSFQSCNQLAHDFWGHVGRGLKFRRAWYILSRKEQTRMGFLDYFQNRSDQITQGDLFKPPEESEIIIDNADPTQLAAYHRLHNLVKARGGQQRTYQALNAIAIQEMLSEDPRQLYDALGIPRSDRSRLPTEAKEALMVGNISAFYEILADQGIQGHQAIIRAGGRGYRKVKGIFPWNH